MQFWRGKVYCARCANGECDVFAVFAAIATPSLTLWRCVTLTWLIFSRHFLTLTTPDVCDFNAGRKAVSTLHKDVSIQAYFLLLFIFQWVFSKWREWLRVNTFAHEREIWKTGEMTLKCSNDGSTSRMKNRRHTRYICKTYLTIITY